MVYVSWVHYNMLSKPCHNTFHLALAMWPWLCGTEELCLQSVSITEIYTSAPFDVHFQCLSIIIIAHNSRFSIILCSHCLLTVHPLHYLQHAV